MHIKCLYILYGYVQGYEDTISVELCYIDHIYYHYYKVVRVLFAACFCVDGGSDTLILCLSFPL